MLIQPSERYPANLLCNWSYCHMSQHVSTAQLRAIATCPNVYLLLSSEALSYKVSLDLTATAAHIAFISTSGTMLHYFYSTVIHFPYYSNILACTLPQLNRWCIHAVLQAGHTQKHADLWPAGFSIVHWNTYVYDSREPVKECVHVAIPLQLLLGCIYKGHGGASPPPSIWKFIKS